MIFLQICLSAGLLFFQSRVYPGLSKTLQGITL
jgi:hypothetical protein